MKNKNKEPIKTATTLAIKDLFGFLTAQPQETHMAGFASHIKLNEEEEKSKKEDNNIAAPSPGSPRPFSVSK
ncbi:hypothetical protein [Mucilaginibacter flavus]|uniref:hypothetical protein n=1 Tax=Mucilaginibacter flavus TaxID=931504 RepID=UPI0025B5D7DC|nr:hypothetical protein [Mucilaginibacter flavus]MDN3582359.1 hypothetical protein [Mucilaginibacter flavus]